MNVYIYRAQILISLDIQYELEKELNLDLLHFMNLLICWLEIKKISIMPFQKELTVKFYFSYL